MTSAYPYRRIRTELPIAMTAKRRFRVAAECGEVFAEDEDFDGFTVTIELNNALEVEAVIAALEAQKKGIYA